MPPDDLIGKTELVLIDNGLTVSDLMTFVLINGRQTDATDYKTTAGIQTITYSCFCLLSFINFDYFLFELQLNAVNMN